MEPTHTQPGADLYLGDCLSVLPALPDGSVDAVVTDPPYPEIDREYGRLTEAEWHAMMRAVVPQARRVLKPSGSAVFVLQPNSERAGRMRPWLWDFLSWLCREWNVVQDAYWINPSTRPLGGAAKRGLLRGAVKAAVWAGDPDCYRDQNAVLWGESESNRYQRLTERFGILSNPCNARAGTTPAFDDGERMRTKVVERGGVCPYNFLPFGTDSRWSGGTDGHPASTPRYVCSWWVRYISPVGGVVLDPFQGSGTVGLAALSLGRQYIGIEKEPDYHAIAVRRLAEAAGPLFANSCHDGTDPGASVGADRRTSPRPEPTLFPPDALP